MYEFFPIVVNQIREKDFSNHLPSQSDLVWDNNLTTLNVRLFHSGYFNFLDYLKPFMSISESDIFKLYRYFMFQIILCRLLYKILLKPTISLSWVQVQCFPTTVLQIDCNKAKVWILSALGMISLGPLGHEHLTHLSQPAQKCCHILYKQWVTEG